MKDFFVLIISCLFVCYIYDNWYFNDIWEGLFIDGYIVWLECMVDYFNIEVCLLIDFFDEV